VITDDQHQPPEDLPGDPDRRVVCVANLRQHKDHHTLLDAIALVRARHPDVRLLLAGAAPDQELAAALVARCRELGLEDTVSFLGSRPDVTALLAGCRVGVLSSSSEGFPLALLEYATAGLAVAATDVGDCGEVLDQGRLGRLVPPGDPRALADAVSGLLDDPDAARRLGEDLQRAVPVRYSRSAILHDLEDVYDQALGRAVPDRLRS
jgi:glycosyltransferase involved in cell wall biosynthesis